MNTEISPERIANISALSTILFVIGIIIAIKMKKGFWAGFGFAILGSMIGWGIGILIFKDKSN